MTTRKHVWVIDDDKSIRWVLEKILTKSNMQVSCFDSAVGIIERLEQEQPDAIITDIRMPDMDGISLLHQIKERYPNFPVIIMTAHSDLDSAIASYEAGAFEYLAKPFDIDEASELIQRAINQHQQKHSDPHKTDAEETPEIIGKAPAMQEVFRAIGRLSKSNITALITGESGTGKELVAQALHRHSPRSQGAFIAINTAAIPRDLLESELFGHERGAFTGAQNLRRGRFEQADGGTLFLDEIGDMPVDLQTRLLRVLADGEFYRVGGHQAIKVDVRIITATHQDLEKLVSENRFREDLYHRLNVIRIHIPALRDRQEDIPLMAEHFLKTAAHELNVEPKKLHQDALDTLCSLQWTGNVRQLENTCRWLTVMSPGQLIHRDDLPPELLTEVQDTHHKTDNDWEHALQSWAEKQLAQGQTAILNHAIPSFERIMITASLKKTRGRRKEAAELLGWGRNTLTRKIKELNLDTEKTTTEQ